ncbi:hypothetical protein Patl1_23763 [Pistacia atlantica]|uniref:Uncharacterized protein n=1 Tax=Pistacia atlantica TaxID=434234 RepID=A0ACC0ZXX9_9ROSI|nr:hypothetical protein Patl1_23763 [Pistacia atlantica]
MHFTKETSETFAIMLCLIEYALIYDVFNLISFFPYLFCPSTYNTSIASSFFFSHCPCICIPEERFDELQFFFDAFNFFLFASQRPGFLDKQGTQCFYNKVHSKLCHIS